MSNLPPQSGYALLRAKADFIRGLPSAVGYNQSQICVPELLLESFGDLEIYYAPLEHTNDSAKLVVVGITPGFQQMELAIRVARDGLVGDLELPEICLKVKQQASFAGPMRTNLVNMLDELGVGSALGIDTTSKLFSSHSSLAHTTSAIRYPTFRRGKNYTGHSPKLTNSPRLLDYVETILGEELERVDGALIVPLGNAPADALRHLAALGRLDISRCLIGIPHPSGANGHRVRQFAERRTALGEQVRSWSP